MRIPCLAIIVGTLALALAAVPAHAAHAAEIQKTPAIVLPIEFNVFTLTGRDRFTAHADVQAQATSQLEHSLDLALARIGAFERRPLPALSESEAATLKEHLTLIKLNVIGRASYLRMWGGDKPPTYSIGPGLGFLAERSGIDQIIFMFGYKLFNQVVLAPLDEDDEALERFRRPDWTGFLKNTLLFVAVVELRTGQIRWMNFREDISADVATRGGANAYMLPTFGNYPKTALRESGAATPVSPPIQRKGSMGRFTVTAPAAWQHISTLTMQLLLTTRDFSLDGVSVRRRALYSPLHPEEKIDPNTDPVTLGGLVVAEWKKRSNQTLQLDGIEAVTLSGRPAFRADFSTGEKLAEGDEWRSRHRVYGVIHDNGLYLLRLSAPAIFSFDDALPDFEAMVPTLKFNERD